MSKKTGKRCIRTALSSSLLLLAWGIILFTAGLKCLGQFASSSMAVDWLAKTTADVSPSDAALLKRSQATLLGNVITGEAWKPYRGVMPSVGSILDWNNDNLTWLFQ